VVRCTFLNKDSSERVVPLHGVPKTNKFKALEERKKVGVKGFLFDDVVYTL
jgi:hypothetical protein